MTTNFSLMMPCLITHSEAVLNVINVPPACTQLLILSENTFSVGYVPLTMIISLYSFRLTRCKFKRSTFEMGMPIRWSSKCQTSPASVPEIPAPMSMIAFGGLMVLTDPDPRSTPLLFIPVSTEKKSMVVDLLTCLITSNNVSESIVCCCTGMMMEPCGKFRSTPLQIALKGLKLVRTITLLDCN